MDTGTFIGYVAGLLTTLAFVPQAWKIWRTRSAKDVSMHAYLVLTLGLALWLTYGIVRQEAPIIVWNAVTLALAGAILAMKLRFG